MIKYLGSKRVLAPVLGAVATATGARSAVDLFTGTTRVAREFKRRGIDVTAVDIARYSQVFSQCYIATDAARIDLDKVDRAIAELNALPGEPGYFTSTFCEQARYFQPANGARVDAIRNRIQQDYLDCPLFPILLTALILAADRVDSTAGLQMAYLKQWAPRSANPLQLKRPDLLVGAGRSVAEDALVAVDTLPPTDLMYLDPPYNQHRYFTNYHIWETLVRWDAPDHYGVARKRVDSRDPANRSVFNSRPRMPAALANLLGRAKAEVVVVSYNDESWITSDQMIGFLRDAGHQEVRMLAFDAKRYVGAQIGIHSPSGEKVGKVSHLRNTEYLFLAGPAEKVAAAARAATGA